MSTFHPSFLLSLPLNPPPLLFVFQAMIMMKGLIGRCLNKETALDRVRADVESLEDELNQLKSWKVNMENKFNYFEKVRKELEQGAEKVKKVLEGKDKKIKDLEGQLRQAKEESP